MSEARRIGQRILIAAPFGRDARTMADLLAGDGYAAETCDGFDALVARLDDGVGAVLLTEEALPADLGAMAAALDRQPDWSDMPFVLLAGRPVGRTDALAAVRSRLPPNATNVIVLDRPLGSVSLLSAIAAATRSRRRQYDTRDRIAQLAAGADALKRSEERFQAITNSVEQMIWSTLPDGFHDYYNDRWYEFTGTPHGSTDGEAWNGMFHADDQERAWTVWRHSLATGEPYRIEYRLRHRSGAYRWVLGRAQPLRDESGAIVRWFGTCTDIQDLVEARNVLARSREELEAMVSQRTADLERANEDLRQSQKMEAVGQLTGGIAHDFNNMLTGVIGGLDIVKRRIAAGRLDDVGRYMDAASASAHRAAALTHRLLAFSRRQSLDSRATDINALVRSLEDLLSRTLGEQLQLRIETGADVPHGVADGNQLESVILNLVINARDAMPDGGVVTIETSVVTLDARYAASKPDISPGRYVKISVSDTGVGMSPEVVKKVFEPFFTTKPIGQGTGLGLSMVYGFARQSGGQVRVHSLPGEGTTVALYLPAAEGVAPEIAARPAPAPQGSGQRVLVIEDDPSVRLLVTEVLDELGYFAIEAADADAAIPVLASAQTIDLMISDVGLPGMNGRQLAEVARQHRPDLPILFVTGYASNAAIRAGFLGTNMAMITKPFAVEALGAKINEMLGGS